MYLKHCGCYRQRKKESKKRNEGINEKTQETMKERNDLNDEARVFPFDLN